MDNLSPIQLALNAVESAVTSCALGDPDFQGLTAALFYVATSEPDPSVQLPVYRDIHTKLTAAINFANMVGDEQTAFQFGVILSVLDGITADAQKAQA